MPSLDKLPFGHVVSRPCSAFFHLVPLEWSVMSSGLGKPAFVLNLRRRCDVSGRDSPLVIARPGVPMCRSATNSESREPTHPMVAQPDVEQEGMRYEIGPLGLLDGPLGAG
jgi:hypothetical protein